MNPPLPPCVEPITEPEILESIRRLPTEDDLPYDDGEPMETARHRDQMNLLIESLKLHWKDRHDFYVGGNMFLHFDPENRRRVRGPDFFLVLGVDGDRERKSWVVWREAMRFPNVIIELLSDSTRRVDLEDKKRLYEQAFRTPEYYLYDPLSQQFLAYHLQGPHYRPVPPQDGRVWSPATELYLGLYRDWLRWFTPGGDLVITPWEWAEEEHRLAEQEQRRAEQERQRAEQEQRRAEQERQRAEQALARLAEYRRRFGDLDGP